MKEFAFGTKAQFNALDTMLDDGKCHVFNNCKLPDCCNRQIARLGFEKNNNVYIMYIDKNIRADINYKDFQTFLERGEVKFIKLNDMIAFCHSLQSLFDVENDSVLPFRDTLVDIAHNDVIDREKLREIEEEKRKPKMVWPDEIAEPLKKIVFGQARVIDAIADKVVISQMRRERKLLTIALLGPTATGKSETAKSLANILSDVYKIKYEFIQVAGSEFIGEHTVHRFLGAPPGYIGHGKETILDPVRKNPNHVIVINEIEKADEKLLVSLMEAIDTGFLGMADNSKSINLNQCILLLTSNIKIDMEKYNNASDFEKSEICRDVFTNYCGKPELSGKICNFLAFDPLTSEAITDIIIKFIREELDNYGLNLQYIDEYLMNDFKQYETKYGARGIRELIGISIGRHLLKNRKLNELKNNKVFISGTVDKIEFKIL